MQEIGIETSVLKDITDKKKTIEGRLGKDKFIRLKVGDTLTLREDIWEGGVIKASLPNRGTIHITQIFYFTSFQEMFDSLDYHAIIPSADSIAEALVVYRKFYTTEDEKEFGVVAFSFELM